MIKENFIPLAGALSHTSGEIQKLASQSTSSHNVLAKLTAAGTPADSAQEAAQIALLDTALVQTALNEAIRVFQSVADENPWEPVLN